MREYVERQGPFGKLTDEHIDELQRWADHRWPECVGRVNASAQ